MNTIKGFFRLGLRFSVCAGLGLAIAACAPQSQQSAEIIELSAGNYQDASIVNGAAVKSSDAVAKSTVALYITMNRGGQTLFRNFCTGTLIAPDLVMTAAHCVADMSSELHMDMEKYLSSVQVVFGTAIVKSATDTKVKLRKLKALKVHEDYFIDSFNNAETVPMPDIALLRLTEKAPAGYIPAALPASEKPLKVGDIITLAGYGLTNGTFGVEAKSLNKTTVKVDKPELTWAQFSYITEKGKSACSGDSGGPAFVKSQQGNLIVVGVTSWGDNQCVEMGAYTSVGAFKSWIAKTATTF